MKLSKCGFVRSKHGIRKTVGTKENLFCSNQEQTRFFVHFHPELAFKFVRFLGEIRIGFLTGASDSRAFEPSGLLISKSCRNRLT